MSNRDNFQKVNIPAVISIAIISFLTLVPIVNTIHIPLGKTNAGIVSLASTKNTSPYTNYIKFLILLLIPSLVAIAASNIKQGAVNNYWRLVTSTIQKVFVLLGNTRFYKFLTFILIFSWAVNRNYGNLDWTLTDAFHEGEYLGFLPNFLTLEKPFLSSFMVHGFGLDVLTSLIASKLSNNFNTIVLTRFFRMTQGLIGYLGCYWIIWELVSSIKFSTQKQNIFLLSSLIFTVADGVFFQFFTGIFAGRDTFFILQLALVIRFLRIADNKNLHKAQSLLLPMLIGFSIPVSFLYVYDRAAYFAFLYLFICCLLICFEKKVFRSFLGRSIFGLAVSSILVTTSLGFDQVLEVLSQVMFWARYGRHISFNLLPPPSLNSLLLWVRLSFIILTQIFTALYLGLTYRKDFGFRTFLKNKCLLIVLLFTSLIYMRITLDKPSNVNYVGSSSLISILLLIYLSLNIFKLYLNQISQLIQEPLLKRFIVLSIALIILLHPILDPFLSIIKLRQVYTTYRVSDVAVVRPDLLQVYNTLKIEVSQPSCFFTLSQEGFWYYLFNKPSCSKFSVVYYARTTDAQETVIHEVSIRKPDIVLFGSTNRANTFEGIPISDAVPIIYRYFLNHYKPYVLVESQWFWKWNEKQFSFVKNNGSRVSYGSIDIVPSETIFKGNVVSLSGAAMFPDRNEKADAVYISYGENNQLIEVAKIDKNSKWAIPIPTMSLPSGKSVLRVWSYAGKSNQLLQIGEDIKINLVAQYSFQKAS
jgi:hypothetical protein